MQHPEYHEDRKADRRTADRRTRELARYLAAHGNVRTDIRKLARVVLGARPNRIPALVVLALADNTLAHGTIERDMRELARQLQTWALARGAVRPEGD